MKTKNNVQKAASKTLAVVVSLVLISFTVNAQEFWKSILENNSFNTIAMAMVERNTTASAKTTNEATTAAAAYMEEETEEEMELEEWMTSESFFSNATATTTETESPLELQDWMTDENFGYANEPVETAAKEKVSATSVNSSKENDAIIIWNNNKYGNRATIIVNDHDDALELEPWMVDHKIWSK
jgi:hypothetical protein